MSDSPSPAPRAHSKTNSPLHGEVIPPAIRVVNPERAAPPSPEPSASGARFPVSTAILAGALLATLGGVGTLEGYRWYSHRAHAAAAGPSPTALALDRLGKDVGDLKASVAAARPDDSVRALKKSVEQLKAELDGLRSANVAAVAQLTTKLDTKPAVVAQGAAISDVVARLDKIDRDPRLADIASRLDRIEHQVSSSTPTGSIAPQARVSTGQTTVAQTSAAPQTTAQAAKPTKTAVLDNWIVRDVYSGIALVEGRSGSIREVVPGETLPGAGEVRSIQRRGRGWIVVTSRGIIDTETW